jgi:hypothetical protein
VGACVVSVGMAIVDVNRWDEKAGLWTGCCEVFGAMPRSQIALETGMHSPRVSRALSELGHEVIVAHAGPCRSKKPG